MSSTLIAQYTWAKYENVDQKAKEAQCRMTVPTVGDIKFPNRPSANAYYIPFRRCPLQKQLLRT